MQSVRLRSTQSESDPWYRSVIVDFEDGQELVLIMPSEKDREKPAEPAAEEPGESGTELDSADAATTEGAAPESPIVVGDDDDLLAPHPFDRGHRIEVEISLPDGIRRFTSVVRRLDLSFGGSMRVEWPTEGTRIQRRDYVRVEITYRAIVWYRREENKLEQVNGWTVDVSAGGVRLKLPQALEEELRLEMEIQTPALERQILQGRVVRSGELPKRRNEPQFYWVAVEFVGVDEGLRKEMTQMVFDIQREQMKKSLS